MKELYPCVCGLDVHKKAVVACLRRIGEQGRIHREVRTFGTMTRHLVALREWLRQAEVTHVAMESTGVFWKPVYNVLEGHFAQVVLVNAQHVKNVPGRKTDVGDAEWIAQLLQCGLLRASFVPARGLRELRELTRHRTQLTQQQAAVANRIHKVLEDANIKLAAVATDILGVSGRAMLEALIGGQTDTAQLAELARGQLRGKIPELRVALEGHITDHHRFELRTLLAHYDFLGQQIEALSARLEEVSPRPFREAIALVCTMPGTQARSAENVLAETGIDMSQFPSAKHLNSWAAICPGNHQSGGKSKTGKTRKGNRWLRGALGPMARGGARTKGTYFRTQFQRLCTRRGKQRALVAVQHTQLTAIYHMLKHQLPYAELGADYFERRDAARLTRHHVNRLERLGHKVTLIPIGDAP
jgi:transposase